MSTPFNPVVSGNPNFTVANNPFDPNSEINTEEGIYESLVDLAKESVHFNNIDSKTLVRLREKYRAEVEEGPAYTMEQIPRYKLKRKRPNQRKAVFPAQKRMILDFKQALNTPLFVNVDSKGNYNVMEGQQHGTSDSALGDPNDMVNCIVFRNQPDWFEEWFFLEFNCESRTQISDYDRIRLAILMERKCPTGQDEYEMYAEKQALFEEYGFRYLDEKETIVPCGVSHSSIWDVPFSTLKEMFKFIGSDDELKQDPTRQITWGFWQCAQEYGYLYNENIIQAWRDLVIHMTGQQYVKDELTAMFKETGRNWSATRGPKMLMGLLKKRGCKDIDMSRICNDNATLVAEIEDCIQYSDLALQYVSV